MSDLMNLNEVVAQCGFFNSDSPVNNGYGCNHRDCEETDIVEGKKYGKCYPWSCPVATEQYFEDLSDAERKTHGIETEEQMPECFGDELMRLHE